ncbi:hypothetical protein ACVWZR_008710 [Bradyrhizobium sp. i1.3.1]
MIEEFIEAWRDTGGSELANTQSFINGLCLVLGVEQTHGSRTDDGQNDYVFERRVFQDNGDGTASFGRIDCYKRDCFVLEAKQGSEADRAAVERDELDLDLFGQTAATRVKRGTARRGTPGWVKAMTQAKGQAERYAKALPADHGWPPFLLICDVGYCIEVYADFTRTGKTYTQFPDRSRFRIMLEDLRDEQVRNRLASIWTAPLSLDRSKEAQKVTREIGELLATVARRLEVRGHNPASTSAFLMRTLFTMFAEDTNLIPKDSFKELLRRQRGRPELLADQLSELWSKMDTSGFVGALGLAGEKVRQFNGYLFKDHEALQLDGEELEVLIKAAESKWTLVEPAIFGTLLERALDPREREKLGAHFTPPASVERLVIPTIMDPLREEWSGVKTAVVGLLDQDRRDDAAKVVQNFHRKLAKTLILDPACGTGNFLYVAMAKMKELEAEVIEMASALGGYQLLLEITGRTITPENFLGIEVNPRAAAIAQLVLWIGYLQWHFRTVGADQMPPEPVLRDVQTIETRDAVIGWDQKILATDELNAPIKVWDGFTMKHHGVTGELVPDDIAQVETYRYVGPRAAPWPPADFIVGNPPFIGNKRMRKRLGAGYVEAVRASHPALSQEIDFVMYWWDHAASLVASGDVRRAGLITTKTIAQASNRPVVRTRLNDRTQPVHLAYAIPNHPWYDTETTAAVRIAMTVIAKGPGEGVLALVKNERRTGRESTFDIELIPGQIQVDLSIGAAIAAAAPLKSNAKLSWMGMKMSGEGFRIDGSARARFGSEGFPIERMPRIVAGSDVTDAPSSLFAIDCFGLSEEELREQYPGVYQHLFDRVKPDRDQNDRASYRENWWLFAEPRPRLRNSIVGLRRYIVTSETSKHRIFRFIEAKGTIADGSVIVVAADDAFVLGVLSSRIHRNWAERAGGRQGAGNDPRYQNEVCFDPFPFPFVEDERLKERIRSGAEELDRLHNRILEEHPDLTLTDAHNVIHALRTNSSELSTDDRKVYERAHLRVLQHQLDEIDEAVSKAYGLETDASVDSILEFLVTLNSSRSLEEATGVVRYIRPEFQARGAAREASRTLGLEVPEAWVSTSALQWPDTLPDQVVSVAGVLARAGRPLAASDVAKAFAGKRAASMIPVLDALAAIGQARRLSDGRYAK